MMEVNLNRNHKKAIAMVFVLIVVFFVVGSIPSKRSEVKQQEEKKNYKLEDIEVSEQLKVPFYIYESEKISNLWKTCYNQSIIQKRAGLLFVEQLKNHRWRTHNPEEASMFVIPIAFMDPSKSFGDHFGCKEFPQLIHPIIKDIEQSPYFKKLDGKDHLLVDPWWRTLTLLNLWKLTSFSDKIILGVSGAKKIFNNNNFTVSGLERRCAVYVPFDPNFMEINNKPINQREIDFFFLGDIDPYKPFRKNIFQSFPSIKNKISRLIDVGNVLQIKPCDFNNGSLIKNGEELIKCKMGKTNKFKEWTSNSKFSLMLRGHDYQSERLFAAMTFGAINLVFSDYIYETGVPFQCYVPWRDFTFLVNSTLFVENPISALEKVISLQPHQLDEIQQKIIKYQPDVLWAHPQSRVAENILKYSVRKCFSIKEIQEKQMDHFLTSRCEFPDTEDQFGDKIVLHEHIH